ncbi:MAG TPA: sigma 54-interacting transcriptional regulator [Thermotogota bacterium]|nr:sigma 54-interacting transcriptional regulator [Thermotogota bacterium]HRW91643.1 sigma 54-interacting transcriptional regulator [Thermotogota bacterium]
MALLDVMFNRVLHSIQEGVIIIAPNRNIVFINQTALDILGFREEEVLGRDVVKTIPNTRLHIVLQTAIPEHDKLQYLRDTIIVTSRIPLFDEAGNIMGVAAIFRDITSIQKMAEEVTNLKEMEATLKAIIHSTHDAISVADERGEIILVNPSYTRITGFSEEQVVGKDASVDIAEGESIHMMVAKSQEPVLGRRLVVGKNRNEVIVDVMPLFVNGHFKGSVGVIHDVTQVSSLMQDLARARSRLFRVEARFSFEDIVGVSQKLQVAREQAMQVAPTTATVLLRGESGTGKELFCHAIHQSSNHSSGPFVVVNCGTFAGNSLQAELFGFWESPSPGVLPLQKKGLLQEAQDGTLFLDEVSLMDRATQQKLHRFLQTRQFSPVGSREITTTNARVVAATKVDLEKLVQDGEFLEDLYYRLNVVTICLPPLRERPEDIPLLVEAVLHRLNPEYGKKVVSVAPSVMGLFSRYRWPGNVRELENVVSRALIHVSPEETELQLHHMDFLIPALSAREVTGESFSGTLREIMGRFEEQAINQALYRNEGNREKTARELGISLRSLYYKIKEYGL